MFMSLFLQDNLSSSYISILTSDKVLNQNSEESKLHGLTGAPVKFYLKI